MFIIGLSQHVVTDYKQAVDLLEEGIANRITAATHVHDASSRSHAIFTIQYTQVWISDHVHSIWRSPICLFFFFKANCIKLVLLYDWLKHLKALNGCKSHGIFSCFIIQVSKNIIKLPLHYHSNDSGQYANTFIQQGRITLSKRFLVLIEIEHRIEKSWTFYSSAKNPEKIYHAFHKNMK